MAQRHAYTIIYYKAYSVNLKVQFMVRSCDTKTQFALPASAVLPDSRESIKTSRFSSFAVSVDLSTIRVDFYQFFNHHNPAVVKFGLVVGDM